MVQILAAKRLRVVLCAPTGRAAKRLTEATRQEAKTIHRLLQIEPGKGSFKHHDKNPLLGDAFIVDESSMIDLPLAFQLVRALPKHAMLILVGDTDQLPSVGPGSVLRDIIQADVIPVCTLKKVYRQAAQSAIVTNAHRINRGRLPDLEIDPPTASDFYFIEAEDPDKAASIVLKMTCENIPKRFGFHPMKDIQVLTPMQRGSLGARTLNQQLQAKLNPHQQGIERFGITFYVGDKVMQLENNYDNEVFNGDQGIVKRIDREEQLLHIDFGNRPVRV